MDYNLYQKNRQAMLAGAKIPLQEMRQPLSLRLNLNQFKMRQHHKRAMARQAQMESAVESLSQNSHPSLDQAIEQSAQGLATLAAQFPDTPMTLQMDEVGSHMRIPLGKLALLSEFLLTSIHLQGRSKRLETQTGRQYN